MYLSLSSPFRPSFPALLVVLLTAFSRLAAASDIPAPDPTRTVAIDGVIRSGNLDGLGVKLLQWSAADRDTPVSVILDSPGGEVTTGYSFIGQIEEIKAAGTVVRCYVPRFAASMAFQILTHCSERYAVDRAGLLWHRVSAGAQRLRADEASFIGKELARLDKLTLDELRSSMRNAPAEYITEMFNFENLNLASDVEAHDSDFVSTAPSISGLFATLADPKIPRLPKASLLEMLFGGRRNHQILYIAPGVLIPAGVEGHGVLP